VRTLLVVATSLLVVQARAQETRVTVDGPWRYAPGPIAGAESIGFDDRDWAIVRVPHTWNAGDAFDKAPGYRRGEGWYRTTLPIDSTLARRRVGVQFAGANQTADVYVNGVQVGHHVGGYTAFTVDITPAIRFDGPNLLAVRVDNGRDPDVPPLSADYTFYGGLYRQVWLTATDSVHIEDVRVTLPDVSVARATVRIRGTVTGTGTTDVVSRLVDDAGRVVGEARSQAGGTFDQTIGPIKRPKLWSPEHPTLYHVITEAAHDQRVTPVGFRWFSVDATRGFVLNGHPYPLRGTNRHQDRAGFGNALPEWANREDMRLIKATGFNFVRLAHYPQDEAVLDEADRIGLLLWEEIPVVNEVPASAAFGDNAEQMLVEMIRQHRNHPSVAFWGFMNEVTQRVPKPITPAYGARLAALATRLHARAHAEDSSRATAIALATEQIDDASGLQDIPDVVGINCYFGWYYGTMDALGPYLDAFHARHPARPVIVSEYGAGGDERIHARAPVAMDQSAEYEQIYHEESFAQIVDRRWLVGSAMWNQFDFGSKERDDSKPNLNTKGLYTFDRHPKDVAGYYRARLTDDDYVYIATRDWLTRAGSTMRAHVQPVVVYSTGDRVELFDNDRSLGEHYVHNATAVWDVPFVPGENRLAARSPGATDAVVVTYLDRTSFFTDAGSPVHEIAVHAGEATYIDSGGTVWEPDSAFAVGGRVVASHHRITGTHEDALYQSTREGARAYRFAVPNGEYEVELLMTETATNASGARVFDVDVNDTPLARRLDLADAYGLFVAADRSVRVTVTDGKGIEVKFSARSGDATVSGVRITRL
jgi:beta-galactosidase